MGESPQAGTWIYRPWHLYLLSIRIAVYRSSVPPQRDQNRPSGPAGRGVRTWQEGPCFRLVWRAISPQFGWYMIWVTLIGS
jgi:hypothetical protein